MAEICTLIGFMDKMINLEYFKTSPNQYICYSVTHELRASTPRPDSVTHELRAPTPRPDSVTHELRAPTPARTLSPTPVVR